MVLTAAARGANFDDAVHAYNRGDHLQAFEVWIVLATRGAPAAQFNIGLMFENGVGIARDPEQAVHWYHRAAGQGYVDAQYNLGGMMFRGDGIEKDVNAAALLWQRAAQRGHIEARYNLGVLYDRGEGVPKSAGNAVYWWRLAAVGGHTDAQFNLGRLYATGDGVRPNPDEARHWLMLAANGGHRAARLALLKPAAASARAPSPSARAGESRGTRPPAPAPIKPQPIPADRDQEPVEPAPTRGAKWVLAQKPAHYTLQTGSLTSYQAAREFILRHGLEQVAAIVKIGEIFVVLGGVFETKQQAREAIGRLNRELRRYDPFIRKFASVRRSAGLTDAES